MPKKTLEFYEDGPVPNKEIQEFIAEEIDSAPRAPSELIERISQHNSSSPADSGGDIDADWEEVNTSGEESFAGGNPTPDQSNVEENAQTMGIEFADDEPLDIDKILERDRKRFELDEASKSKGGSI
jgi:hypothetical protein